MSGSGRLFGRFFEGGIGMKLSTRIFSVFALAVGCLVSNLAGADLGPDVAVVETSGDVWSTAAAGVVALLVLATRLRAR